MVAFSDSCNLVNESRILDMTDWDRLLTMELSLPHVMSL